LAIPEPSGEKSRDYRDIAVLAFPTPLGDTGESLKPLSVKSDIDLAWKDLLLGNTNSGKPLKLPPVPDNNPHWIEITFPEPVTVRTVEFSSIQGFDHGWCYEPGVSVNVQATFNGGKAKELLNLEMPQSSWQDDRPISLACPETSATATYRINICNRHDMHISSLRLYSAARKNNWESEAGWTLRNIVRTNDNPAQSHGAFVRTDNILDLSAKFDAEGNLDWEAPEGKWTVLRIGHVNAGMKNAPAPPEGTGWECDKLSCNGSEAQFAGYIGRIFGGPLAGGLLNGMLLDSWECKTQTWTKDMEAEFERYTKYSLRKWLPAVFGYVLDDHKTTTRFLRDWRATVGDLFANRFYGRMAGLARERGMSIAYETAAGDIFPADIMEYYKHADVPMCEFWHPLQRSFVGSINFKPVKPTASAARLYGKTRVAAEAFTSFSLTWDEHFSMMKEVANRNFIEGVTHLVFHTYTHNPRTDCLPPGTSFGEAGIGTPFLRGQTWWKHFPEFTTYLSRLNYLLERGKPVSDVLWYLGDEINHKPDQNAPFPEGYKYDYCNPDVLLNRLSVRDGKITTPEGITYSLLWLPDNKRMLPETLEKLLELVKAGATVVGDSPEGIATLSGGDVSCRRFDEAVAAIWGSAGGNIRSLGKGKVLSGKTIGESLKALEIVPDVIGDGAKWLHRRTEGADWYYVAAEEGAGFSGELSFANTSNVEIWDPVSGEIHPAEVVRRESGRTSVKFNLARAGSCFVIFRNNALPSIENKASVIATSTPLSGTWTLSFPAGWGAPESVVIDELKAWKDLDISPEARAFSGSVTYTTTFKIDNSGNDKDTRYDLDLGEVEMIAAVTLNGKRLRTLWTPPYSLDVTDAVKPGANILQIEVTSTWFNRLVYDANLPEDQRKTWTFNRPKKDSALRASGLLGPVAVIRK
jgi:hypothetical protein